MSGPLVIDASVAIKWVIEEDGTPEALALRGRHDFVAPDLLVAECANILWKKTLRNELIAAEASVAAALLAGADITLFPMRPLLVRATSLALSLAHPADDCLYLALAIDRNWPFITADERLIKHLHERAPPSLANLCIGLKTAATF